MAVQIQIVIIYSPQETAARDALAAALRQAGADVWYEEVSRAKDQALAAFRREVRRRAVVLALLTREALAVERIQRQMALIHEFYQREPQRLLLAFSSEQITAIDINNRLFVRDYRQIDIASLRPADVTERALQLLTLSAARAVAQAADTLEDVVTRGKALLARQAYEEALREFQRAVQLEAASFIAWFSLGYAYGRLLRWEEALEAYERALALTPDHAGAWNNKGEALYNLRRYQLALAAYERALALDAENAIAWNNRGVARYALKDPRLALSDYERAIALDEDYAAPME